MGPRATPRLQRGQSTTEFLVALIALVPIFLAVVYAGRYSDAHQAAVQASRYVAFQRALQPSTTALPDSKLIDQARARFFARRDLNNGLLRSDDSAGSMDGNSIPAI